MQTVDEIAREIVRREGGYVNDPDDPGGATNYGVTIHTMRRLGLDLDKDGDVDPSDVRMLTQNQAEKIFKQHYFDKPSIDQLPAAIQASVFDMYVNAGANAVKILQRLLIEFGFDLSVDGKLGPQSIRSAHAAFDIAPDHLRDAYGIARRNYYYALADRRAASRKFARRKNGGKGGWITRAEEFMAKRYHLTLADHRKRVSSWA